MSGRCPEGLRPDAGVHHHAGVSASDTSAVRLLAAWLHRRRELTDRVDGLLLHGPTAVDRVARRAQELRSWYAAEQEALEAFLSHAQQAGCGTPAPPVARTPPVADSPPKSYPPLHSVGEGNPVGRGASWAAGNSRT